MPPGCTEGMIPGNTQFDIEIEKLWDELDGMIVMFLKESDHVDKADIPQVLRDLLAQYKQEAKTSMECVECGSKDLEVSAWIHLNSGQRTEGDGPLESCYCPKCQEFTKAIKESDEQRPETDPTDDQG